MNDFLNLNLRAAWTPDKKIEAIEPVGPIDAQLIDIEIAGIYGMGKAPQPEPLAYLFVVNPNSHTIVKHQYGCVCCNQFCSIGDLYAIFGQAAKDWHSVINPCTPSQANAEAMAHKWFGVDTTVSELNEGLVCLSIDGNSVYILCNNCD